MRATAFSNSGVIARIGISMSSTSLFSRVASCSMPFAARCSAAIASNIPPTVLRAFSATPITPLTMFIGPLNRLITSKSGRSSVATGTTLGAGRCAMPAAGGARPGPWLPLVAVVEGAVHRVGNDRSAERDSAAAVSSAMPGDRDRPRISADRAMSRAVTTK